MKGMTRLGLAEASTHAHLARWYTAGAKSSKAISKMGSIQQMFWVSRLQKEFRTKDFSAQPSKEGKSFVNSKFKRQGCLVSSGGKYDRVVPQKRPGDTAPQNYHWVGARSACRMSSGHSLSNQCHLTIEGWSSRCCCKRNRVGRGRGGRHVPTW